MAMTEVIAAGSIVLGVPQAISGTIHIVEWIRLRRAETAISPEARTPMPVPKLAWLLVATAVVMIGFGFWLWYHPLQPLVVEKPVVVGGPAIIEKPVPCPPVKTGNARSNAANSPANTGNNNTFQYQTPQTKSDKPPN